MDELYPEKSNVIKTITLGANTVARQIGDMSTNLMEQIASHAKNFVHFSLAMDESTNRCGTSQFLIFIRGVDANLNITQESASLNSMYNTMTGEDLMKEIQKTFEQYSLESIEMLNYRWGKKYVWCEKRIGGTNQTILC